MQREMQAMQRRQENLLRVNRWQRELESKIEINQVGFHADLIKFVVKIINQFDFSFIFIFL